MQVNSEHRRQTFVFSSKTFHCFFWASCPILQPTQLRTSLHAIMVSCSPLPSLSPFICFVFFLSPPTRLHLLALHAHTSSNQSKHSDVGPGTSFKPLFDPPRSTKLHLFSAPVTVLRGRSCIFLATRMEGNQRTDIASAGPPYSCNTHTHTHKFSLV